MVIYKIYILRLIILKEKLFYWFRPYNVKKKIIRSIIHIFIELSFKMIV